MIRRRWTHSLLFMSTFLLAGTAYSWGIGLVAGYAEFQSTVDNVDKKFGFDGYIAELEIYNRFKPDAGGDASIVFSFNYAALENNLQPVLDDDAETMTLAGAGVAIKGSLTFVPFIHFILGAGANRMQLEQTGQEVKDQTFLLANAKGGFGIEPSLGPLRVFLKVEGHFYDSFKGTDNIAEDAALRKVTILGSTISLGGGVSF
jgi:hypothetical protein